MTIDELRRYTKVAQGSQTAVPVEVVSALLDITEAAIDLRDAMTKNDESRAIEAIFDALNRLEEKE